MSVRFDAASDRISYTGGTAPPDTSTGITVTMWAYLSADRNDFSTMFRLHASSGGSTRANMCTGSSGETPILVSPGNTSGVVTSETMAVGQWSKLAFTVTGTSGNLYVADTGATATASGSVSGGSTASGFTIAGRSSGDSTEWFNGRIAQVRVWSTVLTQSQIEAEWDSPAPVVTSNLWADYPLSTSADLTDHSGNGRNLSAGTTAVTTEDDPPNGFTDVEGTLAGTAGGAGTLTGGRVVHGTLNGLAAGSGALAGHRVIHGTVAGSAGGAGVLFGTPEAPGEVSGILSATGGGDGSLAGHRVVHGTMQQSGGGNAGAMVGAVYQQRWRLVMPTIQEKYALPGTRGTLTVSNFREITVFGDESGLATSNLGAIDPPEAADEWGAIPYGTKYIWYGGHRNCTSDPAIRDLWLAHGFEVENVPAAV